MKKFKKLAVIMTFIVTSSAVGAVMATTIGVQTTIGAQKAKEVALAHAKLKASDVVFKKVELDTDDGVKQYEIEFYHNKVKYEYDIKAVDGTILDVEKDDKEVKPASNTTTSQKATIGAQKAKEIALAHAKLKASDVVFKNVDLDTDDGVKHYEIEFYHNKVKYEYDIKAVDGTILDVEKDDNKVQVSGNTTTSKPSTTTTIGAQKAKEIALAHAKVNAANVVFKNVKLDTDDGIKQYEVEFEVGDTDYEYEIHALTGAILSFDIDRD